MLAPVPRRALCQSISINDKTYENILIEPYRRITINKYGAQQESNYMLIIDKVNTPQYEELKNLMTVGTSIKYNDTFHTISIVEPLYDRLNGLEHHLEVVLV